jgi:predicted metal-dependent enzyme (double-stranded beta helix superfamily)
VFDLDAFVAACLAALDEEQPSLAVKEVVLRAIERPAEIEAALEHVDPMSAIHRSERLMVQHVVWPPSYSTSVHDHTMWAVIGVYGGAEDNAFFRRLAGGAISSGGKRYDAGDVGLLGPDVIHQVTNPNARWGAALHVYGGDLLGCDRSMFSGDDLTEEPFDGTAQRALYDVAALAPRPS